MTQHTLRCGDWEATVATQGAELQTLRQGKLDLLWDAGPLWPRHAPLLFPVVGALQEDHLRHEGEVLALPKHGFARALDFTLVAASATACTLLLADSPGTRESYPWAFRLKVGYGLSPLGLRMEIELQNPGPGVLPASLGLHPAFRWPLVPGQPKAGHRLHFEESEPGPLRRLDATGLLLPDDFPTPIQSRWLDLDEALFQEDALIFLQPQSRGLSFQGQGGPALALRWEGFPYLGIWAKPDPGPAFLCIEPWAGHASPSGWDGEFTQKPGAFQLAPGATRRWSLSVAIQG